MPPKGWKKGSTVTTKAKQDAVVNLKEAALKTALKTGMVEKKEEIRNFKIEPYRFLSNFYPCPIYFDGVLFPSVEHAYQASKSLTSDVKRLFMNPYMTAGEAKKIGGEIEPFSAWKSLRLAIMENLLRVKFANNPLRKLLLDTGDKLLVEGNYWHDNFWGSCICVHCGSGKKGENQLGKLLMLVRSNLSQYKTVTVKDGDFPFKNIFSTDGLWGDTTFKIDPVSECKSTKV